MFLLDKMLDLAYIYIMKENLYRGWVRTSCSNKFI